VEGLLSSVEVIAFDDYYYKHILFLPSERTFENNAWAKADQNSMWVL